MMRIAFGYGSLVLYASSFLCYARFLYDSRRWIGRLATASLAAGVLLHYLSLLERSRWVHSVPYEDLYGSMSLFAWLLAITYLGLELYHRQRSVGAFVLPFVIAWLLVAMGAAPSSPPPNPPAQGPLFALHITLNILAYAAFGLSFVLSLIYLLQNRVLRERKPGPTFWRFPALEVLERMSRSSVAVGLLSLSFGAVFGLVWQRRIRGSFWSDDPKVLATLLILVVYAAYLWLSQTSSWRGSRAALVCALNFLIVLFSFTVVNFYLTGFHRYF